MWTHGPIRQAVSDVNLTSCSGHTEAPYPKHALGVITLRREAATVASLAAVTLGCLVGSVEEWSEVI